MTPANPSVPPSLTPDSRLAGTAPVHLIVSRQWWMFLRFQTPCPNLPLTKLPLIGPSKTSAGAGERKRAPAYATAMAVTRLPSSLRSYDERENASASISMKMRPSFPTLA